MELKWTREQTREQKANESTKGEQVNKRRTSEQKANESTKGEQVNTKQNSEQRAQQVRMRLKNRETNKQTTDQEIAELVDGGTIQRANAFMFQNNSKS